MSAPAGGAARAPGPDGAWRRLHPLSLVLRLLGTAILVPLALFFLLSVVGWGPLWELRARLAVAGFGLVPPLTLLLGIAAVIVALAAVLSWLTWLAHRFRVTPDALEVRSGLIARSSRRAPFDRVQAVNLLRPLLPRLLGLATVEVVTAGQGGTLTLASLSFARARQLRDAILARVAVAQAQAPAAPPAQDRIREFLDEDADPEAGRFGASLRVPPGRLIAASLIGRGAVAVLVLLVAVVAAATVWTPLALLLLVPLLGIAALGALGQALRNLRFTLSGSPQGVRVSFGLGSTVTETIPPARIHAVEVRQPLLWRPLGWWSVRVTTAGDAAPSGSQQARARANVMLPVGGREDVVRVLALLLPGHDLSVEEIGDGLRGAAPGFLGSPPRAWPLLGVARARNGVRVGSDRAELPTLRLRRGAITRSLALVPLARMQSVQVRRPLGHRLLGLAQLTAHTVIGPVNTTLRGLDAGDAELVFGGILVAAARTEQRQRPAAAAGADSWAGDGGPADRLVRNPRDFGATPRD